MSIDVTVVVPVYNPGKYIEPCIAGLLGQSLPRERFEVVFVDDGSTDETPERLDRLSAEHPGFIHVVHQPNSGWPGKPRNVGTDMARGDYVFFSDHDDRLEPEALERMVAMARRTKADVLIPKMVSRGRPVPHRIVRANIDHVVLGKDQVQQSLTPHKLFRREFLTERGLRWLEGKVRLEDELFVMEAYVRAEVISVLGDYPCYTRFGRDDRGNAALEAWEPAWYFSFVEQVIDIVEAHTEPGEVRDSLLMRQYDGKMLRKVTGRRPLRRGIKAQQDTFEEVRRISMARFRPDFHELLPITKRAEACTVLANRIDLMADLATTTGRVRGRASFRSLTWQDDRWIAEVEGELVFRTGSPIRVIPAGGRWSLDPRLIPAEVGCGPFDLDDIMKGELAVVVIHRPSRVEWYAPTEIRAELVPVDGRSDGAHRVVFRGTAELDPASLAGGSPLTPGRWTVDARIALFGLGRVRPLRSGSRAAAKVPSPGAFLNPAIVVSPLLNKKKQLLLKVTTPGHAGATMTRCVRDMSQTSSGSLVAAVNLTPAPSALPWNVVWFVINQDGGVLLRRRGELTTTSDGSALTSEPINKGALPRGRWRLAAKSMIGRARVLGVIDVGRSGAVRGVKRQPSEPVRVVRRAATPPTG
jgi:glycosyltransferase involved in cell wall biosynthesis